MGVDVSAVDGSESDQQAIRSDDGLHAAIRTPELSDSLLRKLWPLFLTDVFVPHFGVRADVLGEQIGAF